MIEVYTDGSTRGNPGVGGAGVYIKAYHEIYEYTFKLQKMSNHEAEFRAVIQALDICQEKFPNDILSFRSDAKVVVDIIEKNHTNNKIFKPLLANIRSQSQTFPYFFIKWIPQHENHHADRLAKQAMNAQ